MLGSDLTLNQGVNAIAAENESFDRYGLGLQASGGAITNFFGSQTNKVTAGFAQFSADAGILLRTNRSRFFAFYQPQYNLYPQYSQVNNYAQSAFSNFTHQLTEHTAFAWDATGARYLSLNEFLPQTLGIGGIGIVVPTLGQQLLETSFQVTNGATTLHLRSLLNERLTFDASLTGAIFLIVPKDVTRVGSSGTERIVTSGADFRVAYQRTERDTIGFAVTPVYLLGFTPAGHEIAETVQGTFARQLTPTLSASVAAGPLFIQSSSPVFGSVQATSYAVNAGLSRQIRQSQFSLTYSRAFMVNFLTPAVVSNGAGFSTYLPLRRNWILLGNATYTHDSGTTNYGTGNIYSGSAELAYQIATKLQLFGRYSLLSQSFAAASGLQAYSFTRNQFTGGIRFNLGNPNTPGGVQ